ncbi:MAG: deoxyribose-phosphate aldolase [bacterium]
MSNKLIDHTLLKATATKEEIIKLCEEAKQYDFMSVCVNPSWVEFCKEQLQGSDVKVCTVVGFPLGSNSTKAKVFETKDAVKNGADEIDMVINVGQLKSGNMSYVKSEIKKIRKACLDKTLKVIIETCYLTLPEIKKVSKAVKACGADFVKTSTGFGTDGATVEHVAAMSKAVEGTIGVKASGGVRTTEDLTKMVNAGATRIGTSNGVTLMGGNKDDNSNAAY